MSVKSSAKYLRFLGVLLGLVIFVISVNRFGGFAKIGGHLLTVKWHYVLVVLVSFVWILFYTKAWQCLIISQTVSIRFLSLLKVKLSGEGVNAMTPLGFIAGDPVRILLLKKYVNDDGRLRSVVVDRLMHSFSAQLFCYICVILLFTQNVPFPTWLQSLMLLLYGLICLVFFLMIVSVVTGRGRTKFENIIKSVLRFQITSKPRASLLRFLESLAFYRDQPKSVFFASFGFHFIGRVLGAIEIMIVFHAFYGRVDVIFVLILTALTSFFTVTFGFVPGGIGFVEFMSGEFFRLYGFSADIGVTIQIVRRLRALFWMIVGVLVLDYAEIAQFFKDLRQKGSSRFKSKVSVMRLK